MTSTWRATWVAFPLALSACIPSNVVAADDRAVTTTSADLAWTDPVPARLAGLYESVSIRGDAAAAMQKAYYWFAADGIFTGAALVRGDGESTPQFQTLGGTYRIAQDQLWLGEDSEPATLRAARGHVRLTSAEGDLVLRRVGD